MERLSGTPHQITENVIRMVLRLLVLRLRLLRWRTGQGIHERDWVVLLGVRLMRRHRWKATPEHIAEAWSRVSL